MAINLTTADKTLRNLILGDEGGWGKVMTFWFFRPGRKHSEIRLHFDLGMGGSRTKVGATKARQLGQVP
jgi:hypothetical protein